MVVASFCTKPLQLKQPRGSAEPQRLAYFLIVEGAIKAWSLFKLQSLLKRITKIELEISTKLHKGNINFPVLNHIRLGAPGQPLVV